MEGKGLLNRQMDGQIGLAFFRRAGRLDNNPGVWWCHVIILTGILFGHIETSHSLIGKDRFAAAVDTTAYLAAYAM